MHEAHEWKMCFATGNHTMEDERFRNLGSDPRFVKPQKDKVKVKVDDRFRGLLDGSLEGGEKTSVDQYGRKQKKKEKSREMERFYDLARGEGLEESSDEDDEEDENKESEEEESDDDVALGSVQTLAAERRRQRELAELGQLDVDLSEGEGGEAGELEEESDEDALEPKSRVAVVNLDWDHIRATDIYRVLSSPLSRMSAKVKELPEISEHVAPKLVISKGELLSVKIYVSHFGRERLEQEAKEGPKSSAFEEVASTAPTTSLHEFGDDEQDYNNEALRQYQIERLRYYYAIATFDSAESAEHVVKQVDGTEFERTANIIDLSYVPDDVSFDDDPLHDEATRETVATEVDYKPLDFSTDALRHSKVKLTWDSTDPHRERRMEKAMEKSLKEEDADDKVLKEFVAGSSDEDSDADEFYDARTKPAKTKSRSQLRSLFGLDQASESNDVFGRPKGENKGLDVTFKTAFDSLGDNDNEEDKSQSLGKNGGGRDLGFDDPFFNDDYQEEPEEAAQESEPKKKKSLSKAAKSRQKLKEAQEAQEPEYAGADELALLESDNSDEERHFDMREIEKAAKKGKKGKKSRVPKKEEDMVDADVGDDRFSALFEDHDFAIDPTHPRFSKTGGMQAFLKEGQKRRAKYHDEQDLPGKRERRDKASVDDLGVLVDEVKRRKKSKKE